MGTLTVKTLTTGDEKLAPTFTTEAERYNELSKKAYDKFQIDLKSFQLLFANPGEDWMAARKQQSSDLHVLKPTGFDFQLQRCTISDVSLPKMKVFGSLPDIDLSFIDHRLIEMMKLAVSIPTPPPAPVPKGAITV